MSNGFKRHRILFEDGHVLKGSVSSPTVSVYLDFNILEPIGRARLFGPPENPTAEILVDPRYLDLLKNCDTINAGYTVLENEVLNINCLSFTKENYIINGETRR